MLKCNECDGCGIAWFCIVVYAVNCLFSSTLHFATLKIQVNIYRVVLSTADCQQNCATL